MIIAVDQFPVSMYIGHLETEREEMQDVFFSLELEIDRFGARLPDKLATTIDYGEVMNLIAERFTGKEMALLETACDEVGHVILENFPKVDALKVTVQKSVLPTKITRSAKVHITETYRRDDSPRLYS